MAFNDLTEGFRSDPEGNSAAPPYTYPRYKFASDIQFDGQLRRSPGRYYLEEFFVQRPGINADIDQVYTTEVARACNKNFETLGTNATTALVTFSATSAGIVMTTAGADNDQIIITPHLDTAVSAWSNIKWGTENQTVFEAAITTGDDISTGVLYWVGLKLTNTPTVATDDDQVFFRFSTDDSDTNWEIVSSIGGTDSTTDSGVAVAVNTQVKFRIEIDSARKAHFFINEAEIVSAGTAALTNDVDFIPYVGIQALSGTAEFMTLHYVKMSRILFE
jgi:hypothetical protein